jgi:hypothetical protein
MSSTSPPTVASLCGLWRRSLIVRPDGTRDTTTHVRWLQGTQRFVDMRRPAPLRHFAGLSGREQLSRVDCLWLAGQEGFAGQLTFDGHCFEWHRAIDFQPKSARADAGSLQWQDDVLVERGRDVDYLEHWHRDAERSEPVYALELCRGTDRLQGLLVRVGNIFMFARERAGSAPPARALVELVSSASSLQEAQALIDCEISFGETLEGDGLRITASTLPWRIGDVLEPRVRGTSVQLPERMPNGESVTARWEIVALEGDDRVSSLKSGRRTHSNE